VPTALIAHVNLARGFRGGERQTELLVRGLAAEGWRQRLVARRGEPLLACLADVPQLERRSVSGKVLASAAALRGADLVHVHEARGLQAAYLQRLLGGAPYVITRRVQQGPSRHALNRAMYRRAAQVVALSKAIATSLAGLDPGLRVAIIPSACAGLPSDPGRATEIRRHAGGDFMVLHVGALVDAHKGQRQIIAVARELAQSAPDVVLMLVGSGPDEAALRAEAVDLPNLRFAGQVDDVGNYLAAADLFLYPSRHEGLGSALLDAMSFGLPIVATAVGGIPEIVRNAVNGFLCNVDDTAGLAAAILTLRADADLRSRIGAANRHRAGEFSPEAMTRRYIELYRDLLPGRTGVAAGT
jgi:glycosyltransferase involved in cell wall biosynthesis